MAKDAVKVETDQEKIAKIDYDKEDVKEAADIIEEKGFITRNDFPDMKDRLWSQGFYEKIEAEFHSRESEDPYIFFERFDFIGGAIESIIFDMDQVTTREKALHILGNALDLKVQDKPNETHKIITY
ncbi:hypothetical protein [Pediococcus cellicola]|uniref:Uncharacterized protein n=1 Tax=Pediococcus cellicola TaxID=319652 RepID=A0A0R2IWK9_9LACO|nr:hypothetical protein [Pediococcus cellicola]KRN67333.1 hypothetical protein IV80_GL000872 [Pediococcus cellicola]GEL16154.1 hypothetical protein PCE01_19560 [Pediococcus cellicola]